MADTTYKQLCAAVTDLGKHITRSAEAIRQRAQRIDETATDTARVAEQIGALRVDTATVAETRETARITAGLSQAVLAYAAQADTTAKTAAAAHDQARTSHGGINEAINASGVAGIHDVDRTWLTQE